MDGLKQTLHILLLVSASVAFAQDAVYQQNTIEQNYIADLQRQLPSEQIRPLSAQDNEYISLQLDSMTSYTKGTAILLPDASEHAASAKHIDNLRQKLTDFGWNTLSLMPPALPLVLDATSLADYQQRLQLRVQAAQQFAQSKAGVTIIIAQGSSAAIMNALLAETKITEPAAFVMLGAYLPEHELNMQIAKMLATHQVPTLDINQYSDNHLVTDQLKQRQRMVNKYLKAVYRQRMLVGSGYHVESQQWVFNEINGWLNSVGL